MEIVMGMHRQTRRWVAWIACFAILLASLAPPISHAMAAAGLSDFTASAAPSSPAVTIAGMGSMHERASHGFEIHHHEPLQPDAGPPNSRSPNPYSGGVHFEHCPFCFTHAGSFAITVSDPPIAFVPAVRPARLPNHADQCAARFFILESAQPRAPPSAS